MDELLDKVREAHQHKLEAPGKLVAAIREANNAGVTYTEIGKILGMSRQGVFQILARSK